MQATASSVITSGHVTRQGHRPARLRFQSLVELLHFTTAPPHMRLTGDVVIDKALVLKHEMRCTHHSKTGRWVFLANPVRRSFGMCSVLVFLCFP